MLQLLQRSAIQPANAGYVHLSTSLHITYQSKRSKPAFFPAHSCYIWGSSFVRNEHSNMQHLNCYSPRCTAVFWESRLFPEHSRKLYLPSSFVQTLSTYCFQFNAFYSSYLFTFQSLPLTAWETRLYIDHKEILGNWELKLSIL